MRTVLLALGLSTAVGLAAAHGAPAAKDGADDPFYKGLQERGLKSLMEFYLKQESAAGGQAQSESKLMLAALEVKKAAQGKTIGERDAIFKKAYGLYLEAIADMQADLGKVPADKWQEQATLRQKIIQTRMSLANTIFGQWLRTDLDLLEVTDRRGGDRKRATEQLEKAKTQFTTALQETNQWLSEIDRLQGADRDRLVNAGYEARLRSTRREAEYNDAWVRYYYAWLLPKDYKAPAGERSRSDLLRDAIGTFETYTKFDDKVTAKWFAYLVIGLAHRELGEYENALTALQQAGGPNAPEVLKIRVIFERALVLLKKGDFKGARKAIDDGRQLFGEAKFNQNTYGLGIPLLEAESYVRQAKADSNEDLRKKGVEIFQTVSARGGAWTVAVGGLLNDLLGIQAKPEDMEPIQLWILAGQTLEDAQKDKKEGHAKDAKEKFAKAADLYKVYSTKVKPDHPNYAEALYTMGACLVELGRGDEAVDAFRQVAEDFPKYKFAKYAAGLVVSITGTVFDKGQTEENRQKYEDALKWYVEKWLEADPDQRYFYALILYRGKKYPEAAAEFRKVPDASEYYVDARYWVTLCRLESFREKTVPTRDPKVIIPEAREVAKELRDFAAYALKAKGLAAEKQKTVRDWALAALVTAVDIYLYPEVGLPEDALAVLAQVEKDFELPDAMRGKILKQRIDALQRLNRLAEAQQVLDQYLAVAPKDEVGPVLRGLFGAVIEDVKRLVGIDREAARAKVAGAEKVGERLRKWLEANGGETKTAQIENVRFDLAALYMAIEDYERALTLYEEIIGTAFPPPEPLKIDGIRGLAFCYEAKADASRDAAQAAEAKAAASRYAAQAAVYYDKALNYWRLLREVEESGVTGEKDKQPLWLYRYHVYYCTFKLGKKAEVKEGLSSLEITSKPVPLGGNDPVLQKKFTDLKIEVMAAGRK